MMKPIRHVMMAVKRKHSANLSEDEERVIGFPSKTKFSVKRPAHWYSRPSQQIEPSEDIPERQTIFLKYFKISPKSSLIAYKISKLLDIHK